MMKLKPCPFCGGEGKRWSDYTGRYCVQCENCGSGTIHGTAKEVTKLWNMRADYNVDPKQLEEIAYECFQTGIKTGEMWKENEKYIKDEIRKAFGDE